MLRCLRLRSPLQNVTSKSRLRLSSLWSTILAQVSLPRRSLLNKVNLKPRAIIADASYSSQRLNGGFAPIGTPNIDKIAGNNGVDLVNYYTHLICGPSRSSFVTGRLAYKLGNPFAMLEGGGLDKKYGTFSSELKARGYQTHFVGKWGIDFPKPSEEVLRTASSYELFQAKEEGIGPTQRGYDTFYGLYNSGHNHFSKEVVRTGLIDWHDHNQTHHLDYPDVDHRPNEYSTHLFTERAVRIIRGWTSNQPAYLQLSYTAPHDPLQSPQEYMDLPSCRGMQNWRRRTFCGMVLAIDEGVGQVMHALDGAGVASNTIIIFSTDNGGAPSVGGFNYPFRGQKATAYEGGIHCPGAIQMPVALGKPRNALYTNLLHIADLAPTLLSVVDRFGTGRKGHSILGEDIDGVDHSNAMFAFGGDDYFEIPPPRTKLLAEYNILMDNAVYIIENGKYKLLLGNGGNAFRYAEPTGSWFDESRRPQSIIEEIVCNIFDKWLGANWFVYGWLFRFIVSLIANGRTSKTERVIPRLKETLMAGFGHQLEVNEDTLPTLDWKDYDIGRIQLFNLEQDPGEDRNIARENSELAESMFKEMLALLESAENQHVSVQRQFLLFFLPFGAWLLLPIILTLAALCCCVAKSCSRRTPSKKKQE